MDHFWTPPLVRSFLIIRLSYKLIDMIVFLVEFGIYQIYFKNNYVNSIIMYKSSFKSDLLIVNKLKKPNRSAILEFKIIFDEHTTA